MGQSLGHDHRQAGLHVLPARATARPAAA
jgi:hypothetical protein